MTFHPVLAVFASVLLASWNPLTARSAPLAARSAPIAAQSFSDRVRPVAAPVRDAGVLHLATNTWTRKASTASLGSDVVYNNTCYAGYFSALSGDTYIDQGRLPSPTSPTSADSRPGCAVSYTIDGCQIAYCTGQTGPLSFELNFYESYADCSSVIGMTPTGGGLLAGLPGAGGLSTLSCWTVTIDWSSPGPGTAQPFAMAADGDGTFVGPENANLFGWSLRSTLPAPLQFDTGPLLAGDPNLCNRFDGTVWDDVVDYSEGGTGMGAQDHFRNESGPNWPGCHFFGPGLFASFYLRLFSDACPFDPGGTLFCFGDGTGTPCPCGNFVPGGLGGCANSLGLSSRLRASGVPSITADSVVLRGDQMPPNSPVLYFQGTSQQSGGMGTTFGDGKRCAGGVVTRLGTVTNSSVGSSQYPNPGDPSVSARGQVVVPGTRTYQGWYRNAANFCTPATFNLTNGYEIAWGA